MTDQLYWTLIPAYVYEIKELKSHDREIFGAIKGLTGKRGYCSASSKYLSERLNIPVPTVKKSISKLNKLGLIQILTKPYNGAIQKRKIFIARIQTEDAGIQEIPDGDLTDPRDGDLTDPQQGDNTSRDTGRGAPEKYFFEGEYKKIVLFKPEYDQLLINHYFENEKELIADLEAADAYCANKFKGTPEPREPSAYIVGWKKRSPQFARPDTNGHKNESAPMTRPTDQSKQDFDKIKREAKKVDPEFAKAQIEKAKKAVGIL